MATIRIKRAYETAEPEDGIRVLVDRVWPRGRTKEDLAIRAWQRDAAPSTELRRWFGHRAERWEEFRDRYRQELAAKPEALAPLLAAAKQGKLTLVYGAKDTEHNQAVVLRDMLQERLATDSRRK
jgi:uncharacterized protein YeaO (DUF488 family)